MVFYPRAKRILKAIAEGMASVYLHGYRMKHRTTLKKFPEEMKSRRPALKGSGNNENDASMF